MTSMKEGKYYRYFDDQKNEFTIIKITCKKYQPDGCMYGVSLKYKLFCKPIVGNVGLIYTSKYYWDKYSRELDEEQAFVECI